MQIILVHTITKYYYSSFSCCRKMQGDVQRSPRNRVKSRLENHPTIKDLRENVKNYKDVDNHEFLVYQP